MDRLAYELNIDGIVGPTHNYSGLSYGNVASQDNCLSPSNPRQAALQGLEKMKFMHDLGLLQAVFPPHQRPHIPTLRNIGFDGSEDDVIKNAFISEPAIAGAACSAAAMWAANAATVSPSADSNDNRIHFTPANLCNNFHRSFEHRQTSLFLKKIFSNPTHFAHHAALQDGNYFSDEGAANHNRLCATHDRKAIELFVFGRHAFANTPAPKNFPARQTFEASEAISRLHLLSPESVIFAQQHPDAIDAGVFHNDVIAVANENVFLFHEQAFLKKAALLDEIKRKADKLGYEITFLEVKAKDISIDDAIRTYLFNSQLVSVPQGGMALVSPSECQQNPNVQAYIQKIIDSPANPIQDIRYLNLNQSMRNGGGPACLRLRVVMSDKELKAMDQGVLFTDTLYETLTAWVKKHYRDRLLPLDLNDPHLWEECRVALDELAQILHLGSIYPFQASQLVDTPYG